MHPLVEALFCVLNISSGEVRAMWRVRAAFPSRGHRPQVECVDRLGCAHPHSFLHAITSSRGLTSLPF